MKPIYHHAHTENIIIKYTAIYIVFIALMFLLLISKSAALSFLIGGVVNIICFIMCVRTTDRIVMTNGVNAKRMLVSSNITRMSIYLVVLFVCGVSSVKHQHMPVHLEILPTAFAFLSVKIIIYFKYFIFDKIFKVKNFDDSLPPNKVVVEYKEKGEENE